MGTHTPNNHVLPQTHPEVGKGQRGRNARRWCLCVCRDRPTTTQTLLASKHHKAFFLACGGGWCVGVLVGVEFFLFVGGCESRLNETTVLWFQQQIDGTRGRISADRRTKPTLMLTIPRSISKSSTEDLSLPMIGMMMTYDAGPKPIAIRVASGEVNIVASSARILT